MREFWPHLVLMFGVGLVSSLGLSYWARSGRGRRALERTSILTLTAVSVASLAAMGLAGWWFVMELLRAGGRQLLGSPWSLLLFGLAVGVPMGLPQLYAVWNEERPKKKAERERKARETTREEREIYAGELLEQIRDASPEPRMLEAFIRGEDGRVLWFEGELARDEGERLVEALRRDLREKGFRRVEARGDRGNWWTNV